MKWSSYRKNWKSVGDKSDENEEPPPTQIILNFLEFVALHNQKDTGLLFLIFVDFFLQVKENSEIMYQPCSTTE